MKVRVIPEVSYVTNVKRRPPDRAKAANAALVKFGIEPNMPGLRFRAFEGRVGFYLIDGHHGDRILLRRDAADLYAAVDVAPHDNALRRWNRLK